MTPGVHDHDRAHLQYALVLSGRISERHVVKLYVSFERRGHFSSGADVNLRLAIDQLEDFFSSSKSLHEACQGENG